MPKTNRTPTKQYDRRIIAVRGDTHAGHDGGLKNPDTLLPVIDTDENNREVLRWEPVTLRPFQRKLWKWHESARAEIKALAGTDPITFIDIGDLTQGTWWRDNLGETQMSDQYFISKWNTEPWITMPEVKQAFLVKGTSVHNFGNGATETMLTHQLAEQHKKPVVFADHWLLDIGGFRLDVAHHGAGPGSRAWLKGNEMGIYLRSIIIEDVTAGEQPPDVVLRGHFHEYTRGWGWYQVGDRYWQCHGIITPGLCWIGTYATMATKSKSRFSCGMVALEIINGRLHDVHPYVHWIDLRTLEIVK